MKAHMRYTGWVVTLFLFGYAARMFEYTVRIFGSNVSKSFYYIFSEISHLYPERYAPFSSPHFPRSNTTRISSLSLLL